MQIERLPEDFSVALTKPQQREDRRLNVTGKRSRQETHHEQPVQRRASVPRRRHPRHQGVVEGPRDTPPGMANASGYGDTTGLPPGGSSRRRAGPGRTTGGLTPPVCSSEVEAGSTRTATRGHPRQLYSRLPRAGRDRGAPCRGRTGTRWSTQTTRESALKRESPRGPLNTRHTGTEPVWKGRTHCAIPATRQSGRARRRERSPAVAGGRSSHARQGGGPATMAGPPAPSRRDT